MASFKVSDENRLLVQTMFRAVLCEEPTDDEQLNKFLGLLDELTDREEAVLLYRYGLIGGKSLTLEETSKLFDITREEVRQIESLAVKKLRHPTRSKVLFNNK